MSLSEDSFLLDYEDYMLDESEPSTIVDGEFDVQYENHGYTEESLSIVYYDPDSVDMTEEVDQDDNADGYESEIDVETYEDTVYLDDDSDVEYTSSGNFTVSPLQTAEIKTLDCRTDSLDTINEKSCCEETCSHGICSVCLGNYHHRHPFSTICGHVFCKRCIFESINQRGQCPLCRKNISCNDVHVIYL